MSSKKRIVAFANRKGGSGKTATSVNLGACFAEKGKRVLIVDIDPQSHATISLGISPYSLKESVYELLIFPENDPLSCISDTAVKNLSIIPSKQDLAGAEVELVNVKGREYRLKSQMNKIKDKYDFILIDCPPSLGILTVNALAASYEVIIPLQTHFLAMEGLGQLVPTIYRVTTELNPELRISGIVPTMCDERTKINKRVIQEVMGHFGGRLMNTRIRMDIKLAEAPSHGLPITLYAPKSRGASDYKKLAEEILAQNWN